MEGKGVLCHLTSLPHPSLDDGIRFLNWLNEVGFNAWQMLPLTPPDKHGSPYASPTAFAAWPELMRNESVVEMPDDGYWLDDWGLYAAIKEAQGGRPWFEWPTPLRDRDPEALAVHRQRAAYHIKEQQQVQSAWNQLLEEARTIGISLIGDVPMFVSHDSADVWAHRSLFQLNEEGMPEVVAGVPPDYFSEGGQKWGTVLYDWTAHRNENWRWWKERMKRMLRLFDVVRIDHFRGIHSNWAVPFGDEDARLGRWQEGPADELLEAILGVVDEAHRVVAEDLGIIPPEVVELRRRFNLRGMAVLHFGFDGEETNPHHPSTICSDQVVYTGTHDNNTTLGWWEAQNEATQTRVKALLKPNEDPVTGLIRLALESPASLSILPLQDLLGLDGAARMNTPGTFEGNWQWSFEWNALDEVKKKHREPHNPIFNGHP